MLITRTSSFKDMTMVETRPKNHWLVLDFIGYFVSWAFGSSFCPLFLRELIIASYIKTIMWSKPKSIFKVYKIAEAAPEQKEFIYDSAVLH